MKEFKCLRWDCDYLNNLKKDAKNNEDALNKYDASTLYTIQNILGK